MTGRADEHAAAAERALDAGDLARAVEESQSALRTNGRHLGAMLVLGRALHAAGQRGNAIDVLTRATGIHAHDWRAHLTLAQVLHAKSADHDRARGSYERAAELNPEFAGTHAALAKLCEEVNDLDGARRHADRAVGLAPDDPACVLAAALVDRREGDHASALARLAPVLEDDARLSSLPPITRALAFRSYGQSLDATGEHARARDAFARAHAERWSMPDGRRVDPQRALEALDAAHRASTPEALDAWRRDPLVPDPPPSPDPVFLIGFPRSGTTLTEQILAAHPGVVTLDEDTPLAEVDRELAARSPTGQPADALGSIDAGFVRTLRETYTAGVGRRVELAGRLLVDKLPLNIVRLPQIARVFPTARLIVAIRDPRDVCVSCLSQVMTPNTEMAHLRSIGSAAAYYARVMAFWLGVRDHLPNPWIESKYEDLVADPERSIRALVGFLGLPWDDAVLRHDEHARGRAISTPSYEAVAAPISRAAAGRWRRHADAFEDVHGLGPFCDAFGYEP